MPRRRRLMLGCVGALTAFVLIAGCEQGDSGSERVAGASAGPSSAASPSTTPSPGATRGGPAAPFAPVLSGPHLRPGSQPSALPSDILIADKLNNRLVVVDPQGRVRWEFPRKGDLRPGQTFRVPDDAFFTPDGRYIVATQEDDFVVTLIDVARHRIVWRYGRPGVSGAGPNRLWNPDDAMVLRGSGPTRRGTVLLADIKNCRLLLVRVGSHRAARALGGGGCLHDPPYRFSSPNGAFPAGHGHVLVTEIGGDWVTELSLGGRVLWSTHPPGVHYPSDSNQVSPGRYLTVDYWRPGQIVEFDRNGRLLWRFAPNGRDALAKPSIVIPLPNGNVLATDDAHDRVIVVDPTTRRIVWQYGVTGRAGRAAGLLANPDGVDLVPPHSFAAAH